MSDDVCIRDPNRHVYTYLGNKDSYFGAAIILVS